MAIKASRKKNKSATIEEFPSFVRIAFRRFNPSKAIKALLERKQPYQWYRRLIFTAFCAWVMDPGNPKLRRTKIVKDVRQIIASKEKLVMARGNKAGIILKDISVRADELGPTFIEEVYYGVGGISAFYRDTSSDAVRDLLDKNYKKSVLSIIELVKILHYHGTHNADAKLYNKPSLKLGAEALDAFGKIGVSDESSEGATRFAPLRPKTIESYMSKSAITICFLYAAADLKVNDQETMLDHLFNTRKTRVPDQYGVLTEWLGKALYVRDEILSTIDSPNLRKADEIDFGGLEPIEVAVPILSENRQAVIQKVFLSKKGQKTSKPEIPIK